MKSNARLEAGTLWMEGRAARGWLVGWVVLLFVVTTGFLSQRTDSTDVSDLAFDPGTQADRAALFDYLVEKTMERDATAALAEHPYYRVHPTGTDIVAEMRRYRDELIAADTDEKMWYALHKISNVRRDRHIGIRRIEGGLIVPERANLGMGAPIRFATDYERADAPFLFVSDLPVEVGSGRGLGRVALGDRLVSVNGRTVAEFAAAMDPYQNYSTISNFWWHLGEDVTGVVDFIPSDFYGEVLTLELRDAAGRTYSVELPYLDPASIRWQGHSEIRYPGFALVYATSSYDLYESNTDLPVIILQWHAFRSTVQDIDRLVAHAEANGLLGRHVIFDGTRGGGGRLGPYRLQRLQQRPFRTTFGNLKISDLTPDLIEYFVEAGKRANSRPSRMTVPHEPFPPITPAQAAATHRDLDQVAPGEVIETIDGGKWLAEWFDTDVRQALAAGQSYSNEVPWKLAMLPKWSNGILQPVSPNFSGGLTVWLSPHGGSQLDQFAAWVKDNELGHIMGMSTGGYSNTWNPETILRFPTTGRPIVAYGWTIGYGLRPNGEILQYNPAEVDEYIPVTRENHLRYFNVLLERTLVRIGYGTSLIGGR